MYQVKFTKQAAKDAKELKAAGLDKKAKELAAVVERDPFGRQPAFEPIVGGLKGMYSRRISRQHRFVYEAIESEVVDYGVSYDGIVKVLCMWTHYETV